MPSFGKSEIRNPKQILIMETEEVEKRSGGCSSQPRTISGHPYGVWCLQDVRCYKQITPTGFRTRREGGGGVVTVLNIVIGGGGGVLVIDPDFLFITPFAPSLYHPALPHRIDYDYEDDDKNEDENNQEDEGRDRPSHKALAGHRRGRNRSVASF